MMENSEEGDMPTTAFYLDRPPVDQRGPTRAQVVAFQDHIREHTGREVSDVVAAHIAASWFSPEWLAAPALPAAIRVAETELARQPKLAQLADNLDLPRD